MHAARASSRRITKAYHVGFHLIIFSLASWPRQLVGVRDRFANQLIGYYSIACIGEHDVEPAVAVAALP
jgi:hypothetical protein